MVGSNGVTLNLNKGQQYVLANTKIIEDAVRRITGGTLHVLGVVGDSVDGKQKKDDGEYIIERDTTYQAEAAYQIIEPFANMADVVYVFRGSGYHVGPNGEAEEWVAQQLGATPDPFGRHTWEWLPELNIEGIIADVGHHQSVTIVNRTMPLEREIRFAWQVTELKSMPHIIIRAHAHLGSFIEVDGRCALALPPMQLQTSFARSSRWPNRYLTQWLGMVLIELLPDRLGTMRQPFNVHWLRFRHPKLARETYTEAAKGRKKWMQSLWNRISP